MMFATSNSLVKRTVFSWRWLLLLLLKMCPIFWYRSSKWSHIKSMGNWTVEKQTRPRRSPGDFVLGSGMLQPTNRLQAVLQGSSTSSDNKLEWRQDTSVVRVNCSSRSRFFKELLSTHPVCNAQRTSKWNYLWICCKSEEQIWLESIVISLLLCYISS